MQCQVFHLRPYGGFHFGQRGIGLEAVNEFCPSDTLYAALVWQALLHGTEWVQGSPQLKPQPPFRISSCFPFVNGLQLLPVPQLRPVEAVEFKPGLRKKFKKLQFVSPTIFRDLLQGGSLMTYMQEKTGVALQNGKVLITPEELSAIQWQPHDEIWHQRETSHVTVDRQTNQSTYYEVGEVRFNAGCGLGLLATSTTEAGLATLQAGLEALSSAGLGGGRSRGLGQFELSRATPLELPAPESNRAVLLSRYIPTQTELEQGILRDSAYSLEPLSGWLYSPGNQAQRRQNIWLLGAGSLLRSASAASPPEGAIVDLQPRYKNQAGELGHPVWRHGLALTVGVPNS